MRRWLLKKITREHLSVFLEQQATDALTIEIGAKDRDNSTHYPHIINSDIVYHPNLNLQFDAHHLPFPDASIPTILCSEVLEHCHTPAQVIDECYRVLQPGGKLILTTRFLFPLHDTPHDYFRFTRYGLAHLCRNFSHIEIQEEAPTAATLGVILQRLVFQVDWRLPGFKFLLALLARLTIPLQMAVRSEYGDIHKQEQLSTMMTSGYYLVAIK